MVEFAKLTGNTHKGYVEVRMRAGECVYAGLVNQGTSSLQPSKEWIANNKDKFLAVIMYEGERCYTPLITGFLPIEGAVTSDYNTAYKIYLVLVELIEQLLKAKVNTSIGPQPFMTDTIKVLNSLKTKLEEVKKLIL